jgi:hypothetical protein
MILKHVCPCLEVTAGQQSDLQLPWMRTSLMEFIGIIHAQTHTDLLVLTARAGKLYVQLGWCYCSVLSMKLILQDSGCNVRHSMFILLQYSAFKILKRTSLLL